MTNARRIKSELKFQDGDVSSKRFERFKQFDWEKTDLEISAVQPMRMVRHFGHLNPQLFTEIN